MTRGVIFGGRSASFTPARRTATQHRANCSTPPATTPQAIARAVTVPPVGTRSSEPIRAALSKAGAKAAAVKRVSELSTPERSDTIEISSM